MTDPDRCAECGGTKGKLVWVNAGYTQMKWNPWHGTSVEERVMRLVHPDCA